MLFVCLSPFLLPHFLNEDSKMLPHTGASTKSQTLSFSSTWLFVASGILVLDLYKKAEHKNDGQAWADGECSSHGPLLGFTAAKMNFNEPLVWNLAYVHGKIETLLSPWYCQIDDIVTSRHSLCQDVVFCPNFSGTICGIHSSASWSLICYVLSST